MQGWQLQDVGLSQAHGFCCMALSSTVLTKFGKLRTEREMSSSSISMWQHVT